MDDETLLNDGWTRKLGWMRTFGADDARATLSVFCWAIWEWALLTDFLLGLWDL
jgi:hypothetical protein